MDAKRIEVGDTVIAEVLGAQAVVSANATVLHYPQQTGESWILEDVATGQITYISEGCTVTLLKKREEGVL